MSAETETPVAIDHTDEHGGDGRPSAYWELPDGTITDVWGAGDDDARMVVRASALGHCLWELAAHLQGHAPQPYPEAILKAFKAGHDAEPQVLNRLYTTLGWKLSPDHPVAAQKAGELRVGGNRIVRFHPDDVAIPPKTNNIPPGPRLVEVKALSDDNWERARAKGVGSLPYGYDWQLAAMMLALKLPAAWVLLNKETGNLAFKFVETPPRKLAEIVTRVKQVHEIAIGEDLATSGRPCDRPDQWPCLYRHLRPEPEGEVIPEIPDAQLDEFTILSNRYLTSARHEKSYREQKDQARLALLELAAKAGLDTGMKSSKFQVRITKSQRTSLDRGAMVDAGIDLTEYEKVTEVTMVKVSDEVQA